MLPAGGVACRSTTDVLAPITCAGRHTSVGPGHRVRLHAPRVDQKPKTDPSVRLACISQALPKVADQETLRPCHTPFALMTTGSHSRVQLR